MAKRQARKKQKQKQHTTLKRETSKKLSKLANKYLDHFNNVDMLRKVGEKSDDKSLVDSLNDIFNTADKVSKDTFKSSIEDVLHKLKTLKNLIVLNISNTDGKKNFSTIEYINDRKSVVDIEFKIQSSGSIDKKDLKMMNKLYKKHKQVKQLFD